MLSVAIQEVGEESRGTCNAAVEQTRSDEMLMDEAYGRSIGLLGAALSLHRDNSHLPCQSGIAVTAEDASHEGLPENEEKQEQQAPNKEIRACIGRISMGGRSAVF